MGAVRGEAAVSSVVGTVLMLTVTMALFAGLAVLVLDRAAEDVGGARADVAVETLGGRILLQHRGGDPLPLSEGRLLLTVGGTDVTRPLADLAAQVTDGTSWSLGESLCVAGPQPPCLYGDGQVTALRLVQGDRLAIAALPAASSGAGSTVHYVASATATTGTITALAAAQSTSDAGAGATLSEGATAQPPTSGTVTRSGSAQSSSSVTNPSNVLAGELSSDATDQRATLNGDGDHVEVSGFTAPPGATAITSVTLGFEGLRDTGGGSVPTLLLSYSVSGVVGASSLSQSLSSTTEAHYTQAATADRSWAVADLANLAVRLQLTNNPSRDAFVDHVYVTVGYTSPATSTYSLDATLGFLGVPAGGANELQLRYRVSGDTFRVEVWDGAAYTARGAVLEATSSSPWTYAMTAAEANGGSPRLRIVDATPTGTTQGTLVLDYARVDSS
jgi:hypothetical protein